MNEIKVVSKKKIDNEEIPIIEGGFGENRRVILVKSIAEIYDLKVTEVNKIINKNIEDFTIKEDLIDIKQIVVENDEFRESLNLSKKEVGGRTKNVYILSEKGYLKLIQRIYSNRGYTNIVIDNLIEEYFLSKENFLRKDPAKSYYMNPLDENGIKKIFEAAKKNQYLKQIDRALKAPQGKKGLKFKNKEIQEFRQKVNKDMEKFLLENLGISDLNKIPKGALDLSTDLMEKGYILSNNLKLEFANLLNSLTNLRFEVIEDNRKKNIKFLQRINDAAKEFRDSHTRELR